MAGNWGEDNEKQQDWESVTTGIDELMAATTTTMTWTVGHGKGRMITSTHGEDHDDGNLHHVTGPVGNSKGGMMARGE